MVLRFTLLGKMYIQLEWVMAMYQSRIRREKMSVIEWHVCEWQRFAPAVT